MTDSPAISRRFAMVDVFAETPYSGNPLPVVIDSEGLDGDSMMRITRWFNQSETTFLLPPEDPAADYKVRIFTLERELPFAGHPTLGTCQVWLNQGNKPRGEHVIQECGLGLLKIRSGEQRLAFAAPPLVRSGPVEPAIRGTVLDALGITEHDVESIAWADNGPGWIAVRLASAQAVLDLEPVKHHEQRLEIGVIGGYPEGHELAYEVRTFFSDEHGNLLEDPVTGSFNASAAQWLTGEGLVKPPFQAQQGTRLGRQGRIHITASADDLWIGGRVQSIVTGTLHA